MSGDADSTSFWSDTSADFALSHCALAVLHTCHAPRLVQINERSVPLNVAYAFQNQRMSPYYPIFWINEGSINEALRIIESIWWRSRCQPRICHRRTRTQVWEALIMPITWEATAHISQCRVTHFTAYISRICKFVKFGRAQFLNLLQMCLLCF